MTEEQTKKTRVKRSMQERVAVLRESAEKNVIRLQLRQLRAQIALDEATHALEAAQKESAQLSAPIDPDMAGIVAEVVGRTVVQTDQSQPVVHVGGKAAQAQP